MCRDFSSQSIAPDVLDRILRAGFRGPSAGNTDSIELVVLEGSRVPDYWDTTLSPQRRATFPWPGLLNAPVLVVPYVDPSGYVERYGLPDKESTGLGTGIDAWSVPYWWVDGGAAVMAMLVAAEFAGLGALFFGQFENESAVARLLGVPDRLRAVGTLAFGHPGDGRSVSTSARRPRRGVDRRTHRGGWGRFEPD